jgi:hypothetical protein
MDDHESITVNWYARLKQSSGDAPCALTVSSPELGGAELLRADFNGEEP